MYRIKVEKRLEIPRYFPILIPLFSIAISLFLMGITIWATTVNSLTLWKLTKKCSHGLSYPNTAYPIPFRK